MQCVASEQVDNLQSLSNYIYVGVQGKLMGIDPRQKKYRNGILTHIRKRCKIRLNFRSLALVVDVCIVDVGR